MPLIYGGSLRQAFKNGFRGALAGAITGAVGGGFGDTWNIGRMMAQSGASGISSEIMGGDFVDGYKVGLITSAMAYAYSNYSAGYNENGGKAHILQDGKSDVGEQLTDDHLYWKDSSHFDEFGNKVHPWNSDQHWFMKGVGKYLPYGDAFAEFHDGLFNPNNALSIDFNNVTNFPTMLPSYAITVASGMDAYKLEIMQIEAMRSKGDI